MEIIYKAQPGSPVFTISEGINQSSTSIKITQGVDNLPDAPNIVTLFDNIRFETILYGEKNNQENELQDVVRQFETDDNYTDYNWPQGTKIARLITAYDLNALNQNIENIESEITNLSNEKNFEEVESGSEEIPPGDSKIIVLKEKESQSHSFYTISAYSPTATVMLNDGSSAGGILNVYLSITNDNLHGYENHEDRLVLKNRDTENSHTVYYSVYSWE